jgi:hypothetical protein
MNHQTQMNQSMKDHGKPVRFASLIALLLVTLVAMDQPSAAADATSGVPSPAITRAQLAGPWAATIVGNTGCGLTSMYVTFTLNSAGHGNGTATIVSHSQCGDSTTSGLSFNVNSLNANGSGTGGLTCGAGCGWVLAIQVSKSAQVFNLVDVEPTNPHNYIAGTAIHQ